MAAVASTAAAAIFGLDILAADIHTKKSNATRFLIISKTKKEPNGEKIDKASLKFELESRTGSLVSVLNIMRDFELNMTKIQSMPIIETPWKYSFFIDVTFDDYERFSKAMEVLRMMTEQLRIFGTYKNNV